MKTKTKTQRTCISVSATAARRAALAAEVSDQTISQFIADAIESAITDKGLSVIVNKAQNFLPSTTT